MGSGNRPLYAAPLRSGGIDGVDFQLLARLTRDPLATHQELAGAIDRSASTVRKRLDKLMDDGVLRGFVAYPAAAAFGRVAVGAAWETDVPLTELLRMETTVYAAASVDGKVGAMAYAHDTDAWLAEASALVGADPIQASRLPAAPMPPLGPLEWRVADAMVAHPSGTLKDLTEASGLSVRTVRARRASMLTSGAMVVEPLIRQSRTGAIAYHLNVQAPRAAWSAVRRVVEESIPVSDYQDSIYLFCRAPDLTTYTARIGAVARLPGVKRADVVLHREFHLARERLHAWIREQLERWGRARG